MKITKFGTIKSGKDGVLLEDFMVDYATEGEEISWVSLLQAIIDYQRDNYKGLDLIVLPRDEYDKLIY